MPSMEQMGVECLDMVSEQGGDSNICSLPTTGFSQLVKEYSQIVVCSGQVGAPDG